VDTRILWMTKMNNSLQHQKTNAGSKIKEEEDLARLINSDYANKFGFKDEYKNIDDLGVGISEEIIRKISKLKNEPEWMLERRLLGYQHFVNSPDPKWGADLSGIHYDKIHYFVRATEGAGREWDEVPDKIKDTFERLGIPQAERKFLAGVASQYESEVVYNKLKDKWTKLGVIFEDTDTALKKYPELFKKHFGTIVPYSDNKLAALNTAVWSGGTFIYVPKGVKVELPLQAYFRINAQNMGQFERTMIIADEDSEVHYIEGCFTAGHKITTEKGNANIESIKVGDIVMTHKARYKKVNYVQKKDYSGDLYTIKVYGLSDIKFEVTREHPFWSVKRKLVNERNKDFDADWVLAKDLKVKDYLAIPIENTVRENTHYQEEIEYQGKPERINFESSPDFFRLSGYYLAEGSQDDRGYLRFSFNINETEFIRDIKNIVKKIFGLEKSNEFKYKDRNGIELVFSSAKLARLFKQLFGNSARTKKVPKWMMQESFEKQKELVKGYFRGDGNYYNVLNKHGQKEIFRINTVSEILANDIQKILMRLDIFSFINRRPRSHENRQDMYTIGISGEHMINFSNIVGIKVENSIRGHKRATMFTIKDGFAYLPIKSIERRKVEGIKVYNFGVEEDESYVVNNIAVHNCTAPIYTTDSLHSAVVEIFARKNSKVRYTTIQNWSDNVYNLVTKRAIAFENATMEWVDCNLGSKVTMKYPAIILAGRKAHGEVLSIAMAGEGQHQDAGAKITHKVKETSSVITSKSICKDGGRTSYRGLLKIEKGATNSKAKVICDALILDNKSQTDTYPTNDIREKQAFVGHEASVSKVSEEQLSYLMSRGLDEKQAAALIVAGFIEPVVKELPMEYAAELNALIQMSMEGSVG
jgi:Fe-S cluster assembly protein SufB